MKDTDRDKLGDTWDHIADVIDNLQDQAMAAMITVDSKPSDYALINRHRALVEILRRTSSAAFDLSEVLKYGAE